MQVGTVLVGIGTSATILGITIMLLDPLNNSTGGLVAFLGLGIIIGGYWKADSDDKRELGRIRQWDKLGKNILAEIESMNDNIVTLIKEIREGRTEKTNELK